MNSNWFNFLGQVPAPCSSKCFMWTVCGTSPSNQSLHINSSGDELQGQVAGISPLVCADLKKITFPRNFTVLSDKWVTESTSLTKKSTCPGLSDITFFAAAINFISANHMYHKNLPWWWTSLQGIPEKQDVVSRAWLQRTEGRFLHLGCWQRGIKIT